MHFVHMFVRDEWVEDDGGESDGSSVKYVGTAFPHEPFTDEEDEIIFVTVPAPKDEPADTDSLKKKK